MNIKGTIIITDPCYIVKEEDWDKLDLGQDLEILGFTNFISKPTIYGDWSCTTYKVENPKETILKLCDLINKWEQANKEYGRESVQSESYSNKIDAKFSDLEEAGLFCADSGMVAVLSLDEVLKYNPDAQNWIDAHPWCVTTIPDYDGNVEYWIDPNGNAHIIGDNFITIQTGY